MSFYRRGAWLPAVAAWSCAVSAALAGEPAQVLLIPNSATRDVMAFDVQDGTLLDAAFIPNPGTVDGLTLNRPLHAIESGWGTILVSDQLRHVVFEFEFDGSPVGVFAPAGGQNTTILNNIRGLSLLPSGQVLVSNSGTGNAETASSIVRFDPDGTLAEPFIFQRYGGIRGPFDVLVMEDMILVAADLSNAVMRYTPEGKFDELFAKGVQFPMQLAESASKTILLAVSSGGFVREFNRDGTVVGTYTAGLSSFRGVHELDNGNLLVTNNTGVHEITRTNQLVGTKFEGSQMRYIERINITQPLLMSMREAAAERVSRLERKRDEMPGAAASEVSPEEFATIERGDEE